MGVHPRQGTRKKDRWGPCRCCGAWGSYRCYRCGSWRCGMDVRFRKRPQGPPGVYLCVCYPRCKLRMAPADKARIRAPRKLDRNPYGPGDELPGEYQPPPPDLVEEYLAQPPGTDPSPELLKELPGFGSACLDDLGGESTDPSREE